MRTGNALYMRDLRVTATLSNPCLHSQGAGQRFESVRRFTFLIGFADEGPEQGTPI